MTSTTTTPRERVMCFGRRTRLTGVLSYADPAPAASASGGVCVVILNAGIVHKVGPGRLNVDLARGISEHGFDTFRFDFAGVGDSPGRTDGQDIGEGILSDVSETLDHLEQTLGYQRFVVMGLCSGADNGMRAAERDDRIVGVALFDPTIDRSRRWYLEALKGKLRSFDFLRSVLTLRNPALRRRLGLSVPETEAGDGAGEQPELYQVTYADRPRITQCLETLVARDVHLFVTFTGTWSFIYNYETQFLDVYPGVAFAELLDLSFRPEADHSFLDGSQRRALIGDLGRWCRRFA